MYRLSVEQFADTHGLSNKEAKRQMGLKRRGHFKDRQQSLRSGSSQVTPIPEVDAAAEVFTQH